MQCWISNGYPLVAFFVAPVTVSCVYNVIVFSLTVHALRKTFLTSAAVLSDGEQQSHVFVYIRLSILMGLEWLVFVLAAIVDNEILWIITIALCASQGLFVFICFVCKKKYWRELKETYSRKYNSSTYTNDHKRNFSSSNGENSSTDTAKNLENKIAEHQV